MLGDYYYYYLLLLLFVVVVVVSRFSYLQRIVLKATWSYSNEIPETFMTNSGERKKGAKQTKIL